MLFVPFPRSAAAAVVATAVAAVVAAAAAQIAAAVAAAAEQDDDENDDPPAVVAAPIVITAPHYEYLLIHKFVQELFAALKPIIWLRQEMGSSPHRIFSEKARNMVATSARLAFFWGLRVSASAEELLMMPSATAQAKASRDQSAV